METADTGNTVVKAPTTHTALSTQWFPMTITVIAFALMAIPTLIDLFRTVWATDEQGHGPIVLGVTIWLIYRQRKNLIPLRQPSHARVEWTLIIIGCIAYVIGRSQHILSLEVLSLITIFIAILSLFFQKQALRALWFPIFFMLFMIPLPGVIVVALTQPLKMAVSTVAELILYSAGYPISRTGVILQIGPYQLLVADACAGLHTLFTLEALGLLYLNIAKHTSLFRNITLAILIIPISFSANVIRVIVLTLITYHLGDEAGQGFLHGFAGMVLFMSALLLIIGTDSLLRLANGRTSDLPASGYKP